MKVFAAIAAMCTLATPALANEPKFVPFMIDQVTYQSMLTYLGELPAKYANPLIAALTQKEQEAMKAAEADRAKAAAPEKP